VEPKKQQPAPQQKKSEKTEKKAQLVYQAKAQAKPEQPEPVASSSASATAEATNQAPKGMFGAPLPGLKVLDPNLLSNPKFQKIAQQPPAENE